VKVGIRNLIATATGTRPLGRWSDDLHSVDSPPVCYYTFVFFVLTEVLIGTGRFWELRVRKAALKRSSNSRSFSDTFRGVFCDRRTMEIASVSPITLLVCDLMSPTIAITMAPPTPPLATLETTELRSIPPVGAAAAALPEVSMLRSWPPRLKLGLNQVGANGFNPSNTWQTPLLLRFIVCRVED
jgi:hypothetical protein